MRKLLLILALMTPWSAQCDVISYGEGSLSLNGSGYTDICVGETIDLQNFESHITGQLDLSGMNSSLGPTAATYFEIAVLAEGQYSFWHTSKGDPENVWAHGSDHFTGEWFNHGVYMLCMEWNYDAGDDFYWLYPQDYMGENSAKTDSVQGDGVFEFDLWLVPDSDGRGGTARLSVNGGDWGPALSYGEQKDQWGDDFDPSSGSYNWMEWDEDFSESHLYFGLWSNEDGAHGVGFDNIRVVNPEPDTLVLLALVFVGVWWQRRRIVASSA